MQTSPHASRSAPLCGDCVHVERSFLGQMMCNHPSTPVDPCTGTTTMEARQMRRVDCAPEGRLFVRVANTTGGRAPFERFANREPDANHLEQSPETGCFPHDA